MLHSIHRLQTQSSQGHIPSFTFVSINGMSLSHPLDVYIILWEAISSHKANYEIALNKLDQFFSSRNSNLETATSSNTITNDKFKTIVLLLDEIDYMVTPKQEVLYNLFDWPMRTNEDSSSGNRLIVIGE